MIKNVDIGTDPEYIGFDKNNKPINLIGIIGGTKDIPIDIGNGCSRQEDNVLAEICIPPCKDVNNFIDYLEYSKSSLNDIVKLYDEGFKVVSSSSAVFEEDQLISNKSKTFGCSESYDVWEQCVNYPKIEDAGNMRSAGFHIHIGYEASEFDFPEIERLVKSMDLFLGVPSILIDLDDQRRKLYGKAGDFRYRKLDNKDVVIVEYRTLGGNLHGSKDLIKWVWENTHKAIKYCNENKDIPKECADAINNNNKELALKITKEYNIPYPNIEIYNENIVFKKEKNYSYAK